MSKQGNNYYRGIYLGHGEVLHIIGKYLSKTLCGRKINSSDFIKALKTNRPIIDSFQKGHICATCYKIAQRESTKEIDERV